MKKTQRCFAVEYKSGRRKTDLKPNTIWGNLDLKSVARDVERSVMLMLPDSLTIDEPDVEVSSPKANRILPTLTRPAESLKAVADTQEISMADEDDTIANADAVPDADAPIAVEAEPAPKKQRKPRMKKASPETAAADTAVGLDGASGQKKRGRKPNALGRAAGAKREPAKRATRNDQPAAVEATSAGGEMVDLLQLEEENQKLRKLLAEKLRAENSGLRKKLMLD